MKSSLTQSAALLAIALTTSAQASYYCPPLGPVLPAPKQPSKNTAVQAAVASLQQAVEEVTSNFQYSAASIRIQSLHESTPLLEYAYTPPHVDARSAATVDAETVFRIGSASKVFTTLAILLSPGVRMDDAVTKWLPELSGVEPTTKDIAGFEAVSWDDVTLEALASHMAGICLLGYIRPSSWLRNLTTSLVTVAFDLTNFPTSNWTALGLPNINASQSIQCSGLSVFLATEPPCTKTDFLAKFGNRPPVYAPFTSPVYSNIAFSILSFVVEAANNMSYDAFVQDKILVPLAMNHTTTGLEPKTNNTGFVPVGDFWWGSDIGIESAAGGFYSTLNDMTIFVTSILSSKLLTPTQARKWLKLLTSTSSPGELVGAPWEILRSHNLTNDKRLIEIYTKSGDLGPYHSQMVMVPDYDIAMVVLLGGNETSTGTSEAVESLLIKGLLPALEAAGRDEAEAIYAGTYVDSCTNSSISLSIDEGPGLVVTNWTSRGVDVIASYPDYAQRKVPAGTPITVRIYPTNAVSGSKQSWRAVFSVGGDAAVGADDAALFWDRAGCVTWAATLDRVVYQYKAIDELVIDVMGGRRGSVVARGFQTNMTSV